MLAVVVIVWMDHSSQPIKAVPYPHPQCGSSSRLYPDPAMPAMFVVGSAGCGTSAAWYTVRLLRLLYVYHPVGCGVFWVYTCTHTYPALLLTLVGILVLTTRMEAEWVSGIWNAAAPAIAPISPLPPWSFISYPTPPLPYLLYVLFPASLWKCRVRGLWPFNILRSAKSHLTSRCSSVVISWI